MRIIRFLLPVAAVVAALGFAAPAQADPGDIVIVTDQGQTNSVANKAIIVTCPSGMDVLGGGGYIWNGSRRVHVASSAPVDGGVNWTQWSFGASEIRPNDYTGSWRVHGYAICGSFLPGLEYVTAHSLENSNSTRHARVTCPGTKKLLSGGGEIWDEASRVVLDDISITSDLKSVDVWAIERGAGTTMPWSIMAYGVCVSSTAVANLHRVQVTSASHTNDKTVNADCDGQQVYGIGMSQALAAGHTLVQSMVPAETDGYTYARHDPDGAPEPWTLTTQLVCGDE